MVLRASWRPIVLCAILCAHVHTGNCQRRPAVQCGTRNKGDFPSAQAMAPWSIPLFRKDPNCDWQYLQSATIVGPHTVITSAHEFITQWITEPSFLGVISKFDENKISQVQVIQPIPLKSNNHNEADEYGELYLLHFKERFQWSSVIRPICNDLSLLQQYRKAFTASLSYPLFSPNIYLTGYASNETSLKPTSINTKGWKIDSWNKRNISLITTDFTWGGVSAQKYALPKDLDSGSALVIVHEDKFYLLGILAVKQFSVQVHSMERIMAYVAASLRCGPNFYTCSDGDCVKMDEQFCKNGPICSGSDATASNDEKRYCILFNAQNFRILNQIRKCTAVIPQKPVSQVVTTSNTKNTTTTQSLLINTMASTTTSTTLTTHTQRPSTTELTTVVTKASTVRNTSKPPPPPEMLAVSTTTASHTEDSREEIPEGCPPLDLTEGVEVKCKAANGKEIADGECIYRAKTGMTAVLKCKKFYVPPQNAGSYAEKICSASGRWSRQSFSCALECGKTNDAKVGFVVHGSVTKVTKWPWHAAMFRLNPRNNSFDYICGATLITRSILITAAHCVSDASGNVLSVDKFNVAVGTESSRFDMNTSDEATQYLKIANITIHPTYSSRTFESDIAVLQLATSIVLSDSVRPACFPYPSFENVGLESYQLSTGSFGVVVGFGTYEEWKISPQLREITLPYRSYRECVDVLQNEQTNSQFCAGYTNGSSVCDGDSGGGMLFQESGLMRRYFIQGIVSHGQRLAGTRRCDSNKYSVFTRVGAFSAWVKSLVDILDYDFQR